jgi:hypothetical protein
MFTEISLCFAILVCRDSSDEENESPEPVLHNSKQKNSSMKDIGSDHGLSDAVELGLLSDDEIQNVNTRQLSSELSDSELSDSYQQDFYNYVNAEDTLLLSRPPFRDVEAQHIFEPVSMQVFDELEAEPEDYISQVNIL